MLKKISIYNKRLRIVSVWFKYLGSPNLIKVLINCGADINIKDDEGNTPIFAASSKGYHFNRILNFYWIINETKIVFSFTGHGNIVQILIENGADVNQMNNVGYSPIHFASYFGI